MKDKYTFNTMQNYPELGDTKEQLLHKCNAKT